jgi:AcrR family transcriptional regulator
MKVPFVNHGEGEISVSVGGTGARGGGSPATTRPLRADAQRNRARILEAAELVFAAEGIEVPVDVIAEKAGVGVGTLYRHFPTKETLCEAILLERLIALAADARDLADADDPAAAFFGFLHHMVEEAAGKRDLVAAVMGAGIRFEEAAADVKEGLRQAVGVLLRRAQDAGAVRGDVTAETVVNLAVGTCQAAAHTGSPSADLLEVVCDGLRAKGS